MLKYILYKLPSLAQPPPGLAGHVVPARCWLKLSQVVTIAFYTPPTGWAGEGSLYRMVPAQVLAAVSKCCARGGSRAVGAHLGTTATSAQGLSCGTEGYIYTPVRAVFGSALLEASGAQLVYMYSFRPP